MTGLPRYAIASSAIFLSACAATTMPATETEAELCRQIGAALPTRSHADTGQTQAEIQRLYATFALACPAQAEMVP